ncbi:MAG: GMC oxidoreductase, partial [Gammaproteobacteria bacterium]|nr:GMC oxidoreductase [Gammaproteobacteria bacterium]
QSDDDIATFIRKEAESIYHPVGSCKMGNDPMAVVDDQLRVHGVKGLRVADASIMPSLISGNTNATCMVIAEKASQLILADS